MTITKGNELNQWMGQAGLKGSARRECFDKLSPREDADIVIHRAFTEEWSAQRMEAELAKSATAVEPAGIVSPVFAPEPRRVPAKGGLTRADKIRLKRDEAPAPRGGQPPLASGQVRQAQKPLLLPESDTGEFGENQPVEMPMDDVSAPSKPNLWKRIFPGKKGKTHPSKATGGGAKQKSKKWLIIGGIVLLVVAAIIAAVMYFGGGSSYNYSDPSLPPSRGVDPGDSPSTQPNVPDIPSNEPPPVAPPDNPLNFEGSIAAKGFLGRMQGLILFLGVGFLASLIGDIVYRKQWLDGIIAVLMVILSIVVLLPANVPVWIGWLLLFLELGFVLAVSLATGKDFTPIAAYFLLVAVFGGLMFTRIGLVQSIFPSMLVSTVPPIIQLGYYFQTMNFAAMAFPAIVYLFVLVGTGLTVVESIRPSGEDKSSRWGSLASGGFGLFAYFVCILAFKLAPLVGFLIAFLLTVTGSSALRSQPAKQWVTPEWSVRSPFDGAMLFVAILLVLVVIFGQQWWLVGLI